MKIGKITQPNKKGQIVIPKKIRQALGIGPDVSLNIVRRGKGIYIHPIEEVITKSEEENSYVEILKRTRGKWKDSNWEETRKKRRKKELEASKKRREQW